MKHLGRISIDIVNKYIPFEEILAEFQPTGKLKHSIVLNCGNIAVIQPYLRLNKNLSGEMKDLATGIYIELCKNDNLITTGR